VPPMSRTPNSRRQIDGHVTGSTSSLARSVSHQHMVQRPLPDWKPARRPLSASRAGPLSRSASGLRGRRFDGRGQTSAVWPQPFHRLHVASENRCPYRFIVIVAVECPRSPAPPSRPPSRDEQRRAVCRSRDRRPRPRRARRLHPPDRAGSSCWSRPRRSGSEQIPASGRASDPFTHVPIQRAGTGTVRVCGSWSPEHLPLVRFDCVAARCTRTPSPCGVCTTSSTPARHLGEPAPVSPRNSTPVGEFWWPSMLVS